MRTPTRLLLALVATLAAGVASGVAGCSVEGEVAGAGDRVSASPSAVIPASGADPAELRSRAEQVGLEPCPPGEEQPDAAVPGLPTGDLPCLDGNGTADLSTIRGLPMVVNVWASWCRPCIAEMPVLRDAARDYAGEVRVIGIAINDDPVRALALLDDLEVTFPSVIDRDAITRAALAYPGPPVTYFVTADGTIAGRHDGAILDRAVLDALMARYLGV